MARYGRHLTGTPKGLSKEPSHSAMIKPAWWSAYCPWAEWRGLFLEL